MTTQENASEISLPDMTIEQREQFHRENAWTPAQLLNRLQELGLETRTVEHNPVFTVEESIDCRGDLPGGHCKNLFLKNKKGQMWLVSMLEDDRLDIKALGQAIGGERLSFCKPDRLMTFLGVIPGSVTPFSVVNDDDKAVNVILQARMMAESPIHFHPLRNHMTTAIKPDDLVTFLEAEGHPHHPGLLVRRHDAYVMPNCEYSCHNAIRIDRHVRNHWIGCSRCPFSRLGRHDQHSAG